MKRPVLMSLTSAVLLWSCSTREVVPPQSISLELSPANAQCEAFQHGDRVGVYEPSQRMIMVPGSHGDTEILCSAPGFKDKRVALLASPSGRLGALTSDLGWVGVHYPPSVLIIMEPSDRQGLPL